MIGRLPLRTRLVVGFAVAMAVVLVAVGVFVRVSLADELDAAIATGQEARVAQLAVRVGLTGSAGLPRPGAPRAIDDGDEEFVQVLAADGEVLETTSPAPVRPLAPDDLARARRGPVVVMLGAGAGVEARARVLARPVDSPRGLRIVVAGTLLDDRDEALAGLTALLLIAGPVALALACGLGYLLASAALRPVEAMRRRAAEISGGEPGARLPAPAAADEIGRLGATLNAMLARIDAALVRERAFVADASHELRTPLAILRAEVDLALARERPVAELRAALGSAREEIARLTGLADDLLTLARAEPEGPGPPRAPIDAGELLATVAGRLAPRAASAGRALVVADGAAAGLTGDRDRLEQALGNLVDNALRHGSGTITLSAAALGDAVELSVADEGTGPPVEFLPRAFERFSRADPGRSGDGAGLGLAIVRAIARAHGGEARLESLAGGAAAVIRLPG